jgi:SAM-dependent methyltransferase
MREDPAAQRVVALNRDILAARGRTLAPDSTILDFGCGSGRHVYEYLDAGFQNVCGYDVQDYAVLRTPADRARFRCDPHPGGSPGQPVMSAIPWPDDSFDFVFANQVFEHVTDQALAYREINRVMKPAGVFLNIFPSKWRPLEPHTDVPFGGVLNARWYLRLWASLGIRSMHQTGLGTDRVVEDNSVFLEHGVNYLSGAEITRLLTCTFGHFEYVEDAFIRHSPGRARHLAGPLAVIPGLRQLFRAAHARVILAYKER